MTIPVLARTFVCSTLGFSGPRNQQRKYQCQVIPTLRDDACERTERTPNTPPPPPPPSQIFLHPARYTFLSLNARSLLIRLKSSQKLQKNLSHSLFAYKRRGVSMENQTAFITSMGSAAFAEIEPTGSVEAYAST